MEHGIRAASVRDGRMSGKAMPQRIEGDVDSIPDARGNDGVGG
ncbi:MAG TPA: hypothetical protein VER38_01495 [Candidatus Eisenbacteria bacterium]|nr:hypothetical protein [Candidatus Eisenbacteria bacterium]